MAKGNEKQPNAGRQPPKVIRIVQDFAVSGLAASLSHIPHHPLYTVPDDVLWKRIQHETICDNFI